MRRLIVVTCIAFGMVGCNSGSPTSQEQAGGTGSAAATNSPGPSGDTGPVQGSTSERSGGGGGGVQALTSGAGASGVTPVVGGESMQGGGSGVGQAAENAARGAAAKAGAGSAGQTTGE